MIQPNDYLIKLMEELQLPGEARSVLMDGRRQIDGTTLCRNAASL